MPLPDNRAPILAPHQRAAVEKLSRILTAHRGAVLADEPGLGKTYVASAVAARRSLSGARVEIVAPSSLRGYWTEVLSLFGVEATVLSHEYLARSRVRFDWRPGTRLVIVDEAHRFRNSLTKRYEGLACMSTNARLLLVTATPVCNRPSDLLSLLKLLVADDELEVRGIPSLVDCFARGETGLGVVMEELVVRRSVDEVAHVTPRRRDVTLTYEPFAGATDLRKKLERLTFPWTDRRVSRELLLLFLERRLESSVAALAATVRRMERVCRRARHLAARGACLSAADLRAVLGDPDARAYQDILFPELWGAERPDEVVPDREYDEEARRLEAISDVLLDDPKLELLEGIVRKRRGTQGLVFTVSYDTARAVFRELSRSARCALLTGRHCLVGGRRGSIDSVVQALRTGEVDLVIATDVGGEGLNLEAAGYVVHYDQPWNPAILEQRNGRICRIGQRRHEIEAIELVVPGSRSRDIVRQKKERTAILWSRGSGVDSETGSHREIAWRLPSRLEAGRVEVRTVRLLRARGLSSGESVELLSRRHREGVERWLERFVREPVDAAGVKRLVALLHREADMIARPDPAT